MGSSRRNHPPHQRWLGPRLTSPNLRTCYEMSTSPSSSLDLLITATGNSVSLSLASLLPLFTPSFQIMDKSSLLTPSLVMMEAAIGISVFLNDPSSYDKAMSKFTTRVRGYIYPITDGAVPKQAPGSGSSASSIKHYWNGQQNFSEGGISQETCRDFGHTGYGLASISHVLETARIKGNDLYGGDLGTRLRYGLGFHTTYENWAAKPCWLCDHSLILGLGPGE